MIIEDSTTPETDDTEAHAVRRLKATEPAAKEDTAGHVGIRRISDAGTDDDTEGNRLK